MKPGCLVILLFLYFGGRFGIQVRGYELERAVSSIPTRRDRSIRTMRGSVQNPPVKIFTSCVLFISLISSPSFLKSMAMGRTGPRPGSFFPKGAMVVAVYIVGLIYTFTVYVYLQFYVCLQDLCNL